MVAMKTGSGRIVANVGDDNPALREARAASSVARLSSREAETANTPKAHRKAARMHQIAADKHKEVESPGPGMRIPGMSAPTKMAYGDSESSHLDCVAEHTAKCAYLRKA